MIRPAFVSFGPGGPRLSSAAALPLEALLLGRSATEAADLLPRLFNLCRMAQGVAARLSLGLPATGDSGAEILRDHVLKLCVTLPRAFGLPALRIPADPAALLGPEGLPPDPGDLVGWQSPVAGLARHIAATFPPGSATCPALPAPPAPLAEGAFENSAAGRQSGHRLLRATEASHGRGPLWRTFGLLADLEAALADRLPPPEVVGGTATVAAARGSYALRLTQSRGVITGISRRTPTDHLMAPGGALLQSLASLPPELRPLAPQVIALHDPCMPVAIREAQDA